MTGAERVPLADDIPEADLAEQQIPVDVSADEERDSIPPLTTASATDADPADLIDQAISVALPADDYQIDQ